MPSCRGRKGRDLEVLGCQDTVLVNLAQNVFYTDVRDCDSVSTDGRDH